MENNNAEFTRLSRLSHQHLREGKLEWYSFDLKSMAAVLDLERKYTDKAKFLMIAFYVDLSGIGHKPFVDWASMCALKAAIQKAELNEYQIRELYLDTIRPGVTPQHIMSVSDSLYLLELSIDDRRSDVETIIDSFRLSKGVE